MKDQTLPVLEDAVRLLRAAPLETFVCHLTGSLPLALGILRFGVDITNPRTSDLTCAADAGILAVLLLWMNCWRSVFAARLYYQLSGTPREPWSAGRVWRMTAGQSLIGATRLPAIAVASLVMFPLAAAVSLYRYASILSGRGHLEPLRVMARARELAGREAAQGWTLLPALTFLWLLVTVNLGVVIALLPQLVRILTGYESSFSRSGEFFVLNPLFFLLVLCASWIAFDPYLQAVYCVRCFRVESQETGADLRAALRALRVPALALLLAVIQLHAAVTPAQLQQSVQHTVQGHEYDWRLPPSPTAPGKDSWWLRLADHIVAGIRATGRALANGLTRLLEWLFGNRFPKPLPGQPSAPGLSTGLVVLALLVLIPVSWLLWRKWRAPRKPAPAAAPDAIEAIHLENEDLSPDRLPEESWLELAERCLRNADYRLAMRAFYLANLAWLGRRQWISIHPGKTNREYEAELRRRAREHAAARDLFASNITAFERAWYGMHEVDAEDVQQFRRRLDEMKQVPA